MWIGLAARKSERGRKTASMSASGRDESTQQVVYDAEVDVVDGFSIQSFATPEALRVATTGVRVDSRTACDHHPMSATQQKADYEAGRNEV